jgi:iron complex transport system permease protein
LSAAVTTGPGPAVNAGSPGRSARHRPAAVRRTALLVSVAALLGVTLLSLSVGSQPVPPRVVLHSLLHHDLSGDGVLVWSLRIPRTAIGLSVGAALGLAGALMQALTRNPLADPGLLGVSAGAAAAVVTAIGVLHLVAPGAYVWFSLAGAGAAAVTVYLLGNRGRATATPVRMALAGAAISTVLGSYVTAVVLLDQRTFTTFRFWSVGALAGQSLSVLWQTLPFMVLGAVLALALARPLNALALGEDSGRSLGANLGLTRTGSAVAVTLLCGGATAAAGPIGFVGLTVPHVARGIAGPDQRWVLPLSMLLAPILLLGADVLGRVIAPPGEVEVGIVTAFVGAPVFLHLIRRRRVAQL